MKNSIILVAVLFCSVFASFAQEGVSIDMFKLDHRASIGFGIKNFKLDYNISTAFKDRVILGVGVGFYTNKVKLTSSSDKHKITLGSLPLYAVVQVNVYKNAKGNNFYLKGGYGSNYNLNYKNSEPDLSTKHNLYFGGAGYQFFMDSWSRNGFIEVTQFVSTAKGIATSTYDSRISYNLDVYAVHLTIGMKLNKY